MDMGVWVDETSKGLRRGEDTRPSVRIVEGLRHQLLEGLIGEPSEIGKKLSVAHEERPKHLWQSEGEQLVSDVFQELVFEEGGKSGGPLRIARRTDTRCLQLKLSSFSTPQASHRNLAKPASWTPQSS